MAYRSNVEVILGLAECTESSGFDKFSIFSVSFFPLMTNSWKVRENMEKSRSFPAKLGLFWLEPKVNFFSISDSRHLQLKII